MDLFEKLALFTPDVAFETAEEIRLPPSPETGACCLVYEPVPVVKTNRNISREDLPVYHAVLPNGKRIALLKTMMTSVCERNCNYCSFRSGRDFRRATFKPDEMTRAFLRLHQVGVVDGLFLSSGIAGGGAGTQDRILAVAEMLRMKHGFQGYIHLKLMPGSDDEQIRRAMELSNRVSVNLEAPTTETLARIAPQKQMLEELLAPLRRVEAIRSHLSSHNTWNGRWPSSSTQFVVGAVQETDHELLKATQYLLDKLHLTRVYYSRFNPVINTPFENSPPENPWRTHRLYQASYLLRDYGYGLQDLPFNDDGRLPLGMDPKKAWAEANLSHHPVEVNQADLELLLRVPGIGPKSARAIINARRENRLHSLENLRALGIAANRAAPYITIDGHKSAQQKSLF